MQSDDPVLWSGLRSVLSKESLIVAALRTAPVVLAPAIVISNIIWAKVEFADRHPEKVSWETPSVSQTLVDTYVGEVFALWMLPTALLLVYAAYRVGQLHLSFLNSPAGSSSRGRLGPWWIVPLAFLFQIIAAAGMVLLSQYTSNINVALHLSGSYMLFLGHTISISMSGFVCYRLAQAQGSRPTCLNPRMNALRVVMAGMILSGALVYFVVYTIRNEPLPVAEPVVHSFIVNFEVALLVMFVGYLASFAHELFRYECARQAGMLQDTRMFSSSKP